MGGKEPLISGEIDEEVRGYSSAPWVMTRAAVVEMESRWL
jgi:hypothetical protein